MALVHPDLDKETEEIIIDTFGVDVYRTSIANNVLVGTYAVINNLGGKPKIIQTQLQKKKNTSL